MYYWGRMRNRREASGGARKLGSGESRGSMENHNAIYIVRGRTGEFEDRVHWDVAAYTDPDKAQKHCDAANAKAKEKGILRGSINWWPKDGWRDCEEKLVIMADMGSIDPNPSYDDGIIYSVCTVPLLTEVPGG